MAVEESTHRTSSATQTPGASCQCLTLSAVVSMYVVDTHARTHAHTYHDQTRTCTHTHAHARTCAYTHREQYVAMCVLHMSKAISFLNNDCNLVHGGICIDAVVATETLDPKLHAFDLLSEHQLPPGFSLDQVRGVRLSKAVRRAGWCHHMTGSWRGPAVTKHLCHHMTCHQTARCYHVTCRYMARCHHMIAHTSALLAGLPQAITAVKASFFLSRLGSAEPKCKAYKPMLALRESKLTGRSYLPASHYPNAAL